LSEDKQVDSVLNIPQDLSDFARAQGELWRVADALWTMTPMAERCCIPMLADSCPHWVSAADLVKKTGVSARALTFIITHQTDIEAWLDKQA
jgi:hypothetical protein